MLSQKRLATVAQIVKIVYADRRVSDYTGVAVCRPVRVPMPLSLLKAPTMGTRVSELDHDQWKKVAWSD